MHTIRELVDKFGKYVIWAVVVGFMVGGVLLFTPTFNFNNNNQANEVTTALVNGDKINQPKLDEEFKVVLAQQEQLYQQFGQNFDDQLKGADGEYTKLGLKSEALNKLIDDTIVEQERNKRRIEASGAEIEAKFKELYQQYLDYFKQRNGWDEKDIARILKEQKSDIRDFKNRVRDSARDELRKDKVKEAIVGKIEPSDQDLIKFIEDNRSRYEHDVIGDVKPTEAEAKAYFEKHQDKYTKTQYKTSHILISVAKDAPAEKVEEARKKAEEVRQQALKPGADFAALAKQYSEDPGSKDKGGDLGYVDKDTPFVQEFKDALFKLEVGQISEPVKSQFGFHIIKAIEKRQSKFEDVKDEVEKDLTSEKEDEVFKSWIENAKKTSAAPEKVQLREILIKIPANATAEQLATAEKKAKEAKAALDKEGSDFEAIAKKYNEDEATKDESGDLGLRETRSLPKEIQDAIAPLKAGDKKTDTTGIVKTAQGLLILKLGERKTWDDFKKQIKSDYTADNKNKKFDDWLAQTKNVAKVEIKDEILQAYALDKKGKTDEALALYEKIYNEDPSKDPYLPFYIAKIYQNKLALAKRKKETFTSQDATWNKVADLIDLNELSTRVEQVAAQPGKLEASLVSPLKSILDKVKQAAGKEEDRKKDLVNQVQDAFKSKDEELKKLVAAIKEAELQPLDKQIADYTQKSLEYMTKTAEGGASGDEKLYESILNLDDQNPTVRYKYGLWLYGEGKVPEALAQVKRALELKPNFKEALVLYGDLLKGNKQYGGAAEYYEKALPLVKDNELVELQEKLADSYLGLQKWDQAKDLYAKLAQAKPDKIKFVARLGDVAYEQKDYATAEKQFKTAFTKEPTNFEYKTKLAQAYAGGGKTDQAIDLFTKITKDSPYIAEAWLGLGDAYQVKNDAGNAFKSYKQGFDRTASKEMREQLGEKILTLKPEDLETRLTLAKDYIDQHIFENAIKHYQEVLKQNSTADQKFTAYIGLGDASVGRTKYEEGRNYYMSALKVTSDDEKKITAYEKIVNNEPTIVGAGKPYSADGKEALFQLGALYKKSNRASKAKETLEKLQQMDAAYKKDDVEKLLAEIEGKKKEPTNALGPDKKPGQPVEEQKAEHIEKGAQHAAYNSTPPTSGPHLANAAPWHGIFKEAIQNEMQVHNLEHGGVFLQYKPDIGVDLIKKVEDYITGLRADNKYCKVIVAPYTGLETKFALTAWKRIDKFNDWNPDRVKAFIDAWIEQGPEKNIACP
ncbi:peptidylprolyl isomerase [Candidatus Acetothermia bacterium]|nr:peptidylprolyl isomerase [Candidatus Acetothermia bacterium]